MSNEHPDRNSPEFMRRWLTGLEADLESASNFDLSLRFEAVDALAGQFSDVMDENEQARVSALLEKIWAIWSAKPDDDELPSVEQACAQQLGLFD